MSDLSSGRLRLPGHAAADRAPSRIAGRYDLGEVIGVGAPAWVYRADDQETGRVVAVKLYPNGFAGPDHDRRKRELAALSGLHHPNLVELLDAGDESGRAYLVMELVEGRTLAQRLLDGTMGPGEVARLGADLGYALAYLHSRGITHHAVKPSNVLLAERPMLSDFGTAALVDRAGGAGPGGFIGTPAYLAPEQVRGTPAGMPADVYALGLILLEALTGRREFEGDGPETALERLSRRPSVPRDVPALTDLLHAMTAMDPAVRPTAGVVSESLRSAAPQLDDLESIELPAPDDAASRRLSTLERLDGLDAAGSVARFRRPTRPTAPAAAADGPGDAGPSVGSGKTPGEAGGTGAGTRAATPAAGSSGALGDAGSEPGTPATAATAGSAATADDGSAERGSAGARGAESGASGSGRESGASVTGDAAGDGTSTLVAPDEGTGAPGTAAAEGAGSGKSPAAGAGPGETPAAAGEEPGTAGTAAVAATELAKSLAARDREPDKSVAGGAESGTSSTTGPAEPGTPGDPAGAGTEAGTLSGAEPDEPGRESGRSSVAGSTGSGTASAAGDTEPGTSPAGAVPQHRRGRVSSALINTGTKVLRVSPAPAGLPLPPPREPAEDGDPRRGRRLLLAAALGLTGVAAVTVGVLGSLDTPDEAAPVPADSVPADDPVAQSPVVPPVRPSPPPPAVIAPAPGGPPPAADSDGGSGGKKKKGHKKH